MTYGGRTTSKFDKEFKKSDRYTQIAQDDGDIE